MPANHRYAFDNERIPRLPIWIENYEKKFSTGKVENALLEIEGLTIELGAALGTVPSCLEEANIGTRRGKTYRMDNACPNLWMGANYLMN